MSILSNFLAKLNLSLHATGQMAGDLSTIKDNVDLSLNQRFAFGDGDDEADCLIADTLTVSEAGTFLDLGGSFKNTFGQYMAMGTVKLIYVRNPSATLSVAIGGVSDRAFCSFLGGAEDKFVLSPGQSTVLYLAPNTGETCERYVNDFLYFDAMTTSTTIDVVVIGTEFAGAQRLVEQSGAVEAGPGTILGRYVLDGENDEENFYAGRDMYIWYDEDLDVWIVSATVGTIDAGYSWTCATETGTYLATALLATIDEAGGAEAAGYYYLAGTHNGQNYYLRTGGGFNLRFTTTTDLWEIATGTDPTAGDIEYTLDSGGPGGTYDGTVSGTMLVETSSATGSLLIS